MNKTHRSFLLPFFEKMNEQFDDKWCVLHSYETLPDFSKSDVDMAFSGENINDLENLIGEVANIAGWIVLQKFWYDIEYCFYYVLKNKETGVYLAIDFIIDKSGIGRYSFNSKELTANCIFINELFPIPNHEVSYCYKVIKRIVKNKPLFEDFEYLKFSLKNSDLSKITKIFIGQFGKSNIGLLENYVHNFNEDTSKLNTLFLDEKRNEFLKNKNNDVYKLIYQIKRVVYRINNPCGMILYMPTESNVDIEQFTILLSQRLEILFRFVVHNKSKSIFKKYISFIGSTFIIESTKNKNSSIRYKWFSSEVILNDFNNDKVTNLKSLVDNYEKVIIELLIRRNSLKI